MSIKSIINERIFLIAFFGIALFSTAANAPGIFDYDSMYLDDMSRYELALNNTVHAQIIERNFFRAYVIYVGYELLTVDPVYARLYILAFMIASSYLFFYILYKKLNVPASVAIIASVLPNILPGLTMIPSFIDGSYTVPGNLVYLLFLLSVIEYLRNDLKPYYLLLIAFLYYASLEMMDQAFFLIAPVLFLILAFQGYRITRRKIYAGGTIVLVALQDLYFYLKVEQPVYMTSVTLSAPEIQSRMIQSLHYILPINTEAGKIGIIMSAITTGIVFLGVVAYILINISWFKSSKEENQFLRREWTQMDHLLFGVLWFLSVAFIFWFESPYFSDRYFHLPAFGSSLFLSYMFYFTYRRFLDHKIGEWIILLTTGIFVLTTTITSYRILRSIVEPQNHYHNLIKNKISKYPLPENSQIIIAGSTPIPTGGYWVYSSGYLKYMTGRKDVEGILSYPELQYYDPFRTSDRGFIYKMSGIDLTRPVFPFRIESPGSVKYKKHVLRWKASRFTKGLPGHTGLGAAEPEDLRTSDWEILEFDPNSGDSIVVAKGKGLEQYRKQLIILEKKGMNTADILFAGKMSRETLDRFGLLQEENR